jgi:hypothetical protein
MVYSQANNERVVIGTLLNEFGQDGFYERNNMVLRSEMFTDVRNRFLFDTICQMKHEGLTATTPFDVLTFLQRKQIPYGDTQQLVSYMTDVAMNFALKTFDEQVTQLAQQYIRRKRREQLSK